MLDNREISVVVWFAVFLVWGFSKVEVRKASVDVVKAALAWRIVFCISMMTAYIALVVFALHAVGFWDINKLKATVLWSFTAALVMVFDVGKGPDDQNYFRKAVRDGFKVSVVLEFIVNLYVFKLYLELLLIPTATILACMLVIAESKDEYKIVRAPLNTILAVLGLVLLVYSVNHIFTDSRSFAQVSTLISFLLPIVLTMLFLPFLYLLAAVVSYESMSVRLKLFMNDPELRRFAKMQLFRRFGLNFLGLNRWVGRFVYDRPRTRAEILASIQRVSTASCESGENSK